MLNKDKPWFDDQCRNAFGLKQEAHLRRNRDSSRVNWEEFVRCQVITNEIYSEAKHQFSFRNRDVDMNVQSHFKWLVYSQVCCVRLEFVIATACWWGGGGLVCESVGKADLLSDHFNGTQSMESVDLPLTCHLSPGLTTIAFRSSEVKHLLLALDSYGGTDTSGMFPLFLKRTFDVLVPRLSVVFRRLVRLGNFPACWRQAHVTPIPKGPTSSSV